MKACFIGLGYIGLPTAIIAARHGIEILGVDINSVIVEKTNRGELHFMEPGLEQYLTEALTSGHFRASTTPEISDAYFIVVPTPFKGGNHEPDISYVEAATRSIIPLLKEEDLYVIESTSPVGTTEKMAELIFSERPELKNKIHIAYCPERVLPGEIIYELEHNDRVIGGLDTASTEKAKDLYGLFVKGQLHGTNARTAEICKLTENSSRDVQIAFANELSIICEKAGIEVRELIALANKHPRVNILQPGCGVGGHCIAIDPYFITADFPRESRMIATAREINNYKSFWCVERIQDVIGTFNREQSRSPNVALMGLAFKPNIDDLRESPAIQIAKKIMQSRNNANIMIAEPNVKKHNIFNLTEYKEAYDKADIAIFLIAHNQFMTLPYQKEKIVLDFCGVHNNHEFV